MSDMHLDRLHRVDRRHNSNDDLANDASLLLARYVVAATVVLSSVDGILEHLAVGLRVACTRCRRCLGFFSVLCCSVWMWVMIHVTVGRI